MLVPGLGPTSFDSFSPLVMCVFFEMSLSQRCSHWPLCSNWFSSHPCHLPWLCFLLSIYQNLVFSCSLRCLRFAVCLTQLKCQLQESKDFCCWACPLLHLPVLKMVPSARGLSILVLSEYMFLWFSMALSLWKSKWRERNQKGECLVLHMEESFVEKHLLITDLYRTGPHSVGPDWWGEQSPIYSYSKLGNI